MLREIATLLLFCQAGCTFGYTDQPILDVMAGKLAAGSRITVTGTMETTGINYYSLFAPEETTSGFKCIALILNDRDIKIAKSLNGQRAEVRGMIIPIDDLNEMIPTSRGEINKRLWTGTPCTGEAAIFVTKLKRIE